MRNNCKFTDEEKSEFKKLGFKLHLFDALLLSDYISIGEFEEGYIEISLTHANYNHMTETRYNYRFEIRKYKTLYDTESDPYIGMCLDSFHYTLEDLIKYIKNDSDYICNIKKTKL